MVGSGELRVDEDKVVAVADWEVPSDIKGLQSFLSFANYYNRFIPNFATIAAPISNLLSGKQALCEVLSRKVPLLN